MKTAILQLLAQVDQDKGIHIRYACESGSRARGFPKRQILRRQNKYWQN